MKVRAHFVTRRNFGQAGEEFIRVDVAAEAERHGRLWLWGIPEVTSWDGPLNEEPNFWALSEKETSQAWSVLELARDEAVKS